MADLEKLHSKLERKILTDYRSAYSYQFSGK